MANPAYEERHLLGLTEEDQQRGYKKKQKKEFNIQDYLPYFAQSIDRAENDPTGMKGVRSIETSDPSQVLKNSVQNNFNRWQTGQQPAPWIKERPKKFVDFMQKRWAPIGAENDPDNLNVNWAPNVRAILKQMLGEEEYRKLQEMDMVRNQVSPAMTEGGYYG